MTARRDTTNQLLGEIDKVIGQQYCGWHPACGYELLSLCSDPQTCAAILMRLGVTAGNHQYEVREYPSTKAVA